MFAVKNNILKTYHRIDKMEQKNQQQHHATHLQLSAVTTTLQSVTTTMASLEDRVVNTQRAILSQATEVSLNRNLADLKTSMATMQMRLFLEMDPVRREEGGKVLKKMENQEKELLDKISTSNRDFLSVVGGGGLSQIQSPHPPLPSLTTSVPSRLPPPIPVHKNRRSNDATSPGLEDRLQFSSKHRRVRDVVTDDEFDDTGGIPMYTDSSAPTEVNVQPVATTVRQPLPVVIKSMLMAAHNDNSDPMKPSTQPLPQTKGIF